MNHIHAKCNTDNNTEVLYIGADVAKTKIDIAFKEREGFCHFSIPNTLEGMNTLVNKLRRTKACCHVILEPTGYYSRLLVYTLVTKKLLFQKSIPVLFVISLALKVSFPKRIRLMHAFCHGTANFTILKQTVLFHQKEKN